MIVGLEESFAAAAGATKDGSDRQRQRTGLPSASHASSATTETYGVDVTDDEIGATSSRYYAP
jgi:hypothetical protein